MTNTMNDTILLVEDDEADVELATHIIREKAPAARVITANNGSAALNILFPGNVSVDSADLKNLHLIFLDLRMPGIDGFEVLRRIKSSDERKHIPVVVLTSSQEIKDIEYCYEHGANSYVVKPISVERYEQVMENILFYWLNINQTATTHLSVPMAHS